MAGCNRFCSVSLEIGCGDKVTPRVSACIHRVWSWGSVIFLLPDSESWFAIYIMTVSVIAWMVSMSLESTCLLLPEASFARLEQSWKCLSRARCISLLHINHCHTLYGRLDQLNPLTKHCCNAYYCGTMYATLSMAFHFLPFRLSALNINNPPVPAYAFE